MSRDYGTNILLDIQDSKVEQYRRMKLGKKTKEKREWMSRTSEMEASVKRRAA